MEGEGGVSNLYIGRYRDIVSKKSFKKYGFDENKDAVVPNSSFT